ncbi:MAG TPA: hypothetical protein VMU12_02300 [Candidatus Paceibacterota bacterium]|nr:hypothetical protein [Candidatus Paceibacterota bacterium]
MRQGTHMVRVCARDRTGLAIGSYRTQFCPECSPDNRALYCAVCGNPVYVTALGHPYCAICDRILQPRDTFFRGTARSA